MNNFFITYDLSNPGRDYQKLYNKLISMGAQRVLLSVWVLKGIYNAADLRDILKTYIDANDRLLIVQNANWASFRSMININEV